MAELKRTFGLKLKALRQQTKLSQEELAEVCGVSTETISFIERGIHGPRFDLLERLAKALDVEVWQLFKPTP